MIPYEVDPSLHATPPEPVRLDDGCVPHGTEAPPQPTVHGAQEAVAQLEAKSPF